MSLLLSTIALLSTAAHASTAVITQAEGEVLIHEGAGVDGEAASSPSPLSADACLEIREGGRVTILHDGISAELTEPGWVCHDDLPTPPEAGGREGVLYRSGATASNQDHLSGYGGLDGLGTRGHGDGASGYGTGGGVLGAKGSGSIGRIGGDPIILGALDQSLIDVVIKRHMNQIRYCHQRELNKEPTLSGEIVIKFTIAGDGSVSKASVKSSTMGSSAVEDCIVGRFMRFQFPEPTDGVVIVSYPFIFKDAE